MQHIMMCISGWAGTGKDECTGHLVRKHGAVHTGLADPGKRHMMDAYAFSYDQLWGPSSFRNAGDPRYPKPIVKRLNLEPVEGIDNYFGRVVTKENWMEVVEDFTFDPNLSDFVREKVLSYEDGEFIPFRIGVKATDPKFFLSPRESLQEYLELMNKLYADTWIRKGIEINKKLADVEVSKLIGNQMKRKYLYSKEKGVVDHEFPWEYSNGNVITCYSDFRHIHEHRLARHSISETLNPVLVRIKRPTVTKAPFNHRSETEQTRIRDSAYDFIINNSGSLDDLYLALDGIVRTCSNPNWVGLEWSEDFVLPTEQEEYQP